VGRAQFVPQLLEANGAFGVSVLPQQVYHFAVGTSDAVRGARNRLSQYIADGPAKAIRVGNRARHEFREGISGVEHHELAGAHRAIYIQTL